MNSVEPKVELSELEAEEKKSYQPPKVLASYDKKRLEAAMEKASVSAGCSCGCG